MREVLHAERHKCNIAKASQKKTIQLSTPREHCPPQKKTQRCMANTPGTYAARKNVASFCKEDLRLTTIHSTMTASQKRLERYVLAFYLLLVISFQVLREKRRGARSSIGRVCGASASCLGPSLRLKKKISSTHLRASSEKN